ncbi:cyclophane-forming radical SAM/SPASM peptide maturase GrrM/OscB [Roseibium sp. HPY-6]|uniref:cyclophane-forming radical SAM/SPASM peptide maturase GrrM/OscB n=1 Tax=Roseibium sp. HPY-6 TaxID=3229852 RepID=UPI00338EDE15
MAARPVKRRCTSLLVLQSTPFCNIDCSYCYLPHRSDSSRMPIETAAGAVNWLVREGLAPDRISIAWHAGEPLVLPVEWYREAFDAIDEAAVGRDVVHSIQTNAMLINDDWCDLFLERNVQIGVSIDGPKELHDANRKTRTGAGTHAQAMRGIARLRDSGIPFHVIAVVTAATVSGCAVNFAAFMEDLRAEEIGLNFEEQEGVNVSSSLGPFAVAPEMRSFLTELVDYAARSPSLKMREMRTIAAMLRDPEFGRRGRNSENEPFTIVTVDVEGNLYTYSPELAGQRSAHYQNYRLGNVFQDRLAEIVTREPFLTLESDIAAGVAECSVKCPYFCVCQGGAPSNKIAELATMRGTETAACRHYKQALSDVILLRLEQDLGKCVRA